MQMHLHLQLGSQVETFWVDVAHVGVAFEWDIGL